LNLNIVIINLIHLKLQIIVIIYMRNTCYSYWRKNLGNSLMYKINHWFFFFFFVVVFCLWKRNNPLGRQRGETATCRHFITRRRDARLLIRQILARREPSSSSSSKRFSDGHDRARENGLHGARAPPVTAKSERGHGNRTRGERVSERNTSTGSRETRSPALIRNTRVTLSVINGGNAKPFRSRS